MQTHFDTSKLRSLFGLLQTLGLPVSTSLAAHSLMALAIAGLVIWAWRSHLAYELKAALLATAAIMASPYVFAYDLVVLCVAQAFLVRHVLARGGVTMPEFAGLAMVNLLQPLSGALSGLLLIALVFRRAAMEETVDRQGAAAPLPAI